MAWNDITLSTTDSIARHEYNINDLAPISGSWLDTIDIAKERVGNDIIGRLSNNAADLDNIQNPSTLRLASDYMTLSLIYVQLANSGYALMYLAKRNWYWNMYNALLAQAIPRIKMNNYLSLVLAGQFRL